MPNPKKTQEEKELIGTARKDRVEADFITPEPVETIPDPPAYLDKTGRKQWKKYTKLLQNGGILVETDLDSLGLYCMHLQIAEKAAEALKDELFHPSVNEAGETYYVGTAVVLRTFNEASAAAMKYSQQFGFTPVSRKNVPVPKKKDKPGLLQMLKDKRKNESVFKVA